MTTKILEGVRIAEFGWAVVGPLTASWAGNYGAEVIKVETRTRPDIIRTMTPFKNDRFHVDNSLFFGRENASKYSLALNLKRGIGPHSVDALAWRQPDGDIEVVDFAVASTDHTSFVALAWQIVEGPAGYDPYPNHPGC